MRRVWLIAALAALSLAAPAYATPELVKVGDFHAPVHVASPPGDGRLFVVDQDGKVIVLAPDGTRHTFLDITDTTAQDSEQGLLSIAFPPDYAQSGRFYVYQVLAADSSVNVVRYQVSATDPNAADPASRHVVLSVPHPEAHNHNGGMLNFGRDGKLYAGTGDGGNSYDRPTRDAQNPASNLGKLLRIDTATDAVETYALGVRNPWRWSFDRGTGDMWIGDVGQNTREEVDVLRAGTPAGSNLGWVCWEGDQHTIESNDDACSAADFAAIHNYVPPVISLEHSAGWVSIIGGVVVRDPQVPSLLGRYVWADLGRDHLLSTPASAPGPVRDETALTMSQTDTFGEDACGRVYIGVDPGYSHKDGSVYRIEENKPSTCRYAQVPVTARDTTPCKLSLRTARHQHVRRARRFTIVVTASEPCTLTISSARLRPRTVHVNGATPTRVRMHVSARLLRALSRHRSVATRVRVSAVDAAGNRSTLARTLRARR